MTPCWMKHCPNTPLACAAAKLLGTGGAMCLNNAPCGGGKLISRCLRAMEHRGVLLGIAWHGTARCRNTLQIQLTSTHAPKNTHGVHLAARHRFGIPSSWAQEIVTRLRGGVIIYTKGGSTDRFAVAKPYIKYTVRGQHLQGITQHRMP